MFLRCSSPEELSIFLIDQGSTWGRSEQAILGSDELLMVEKLYLLNTLCTVGFPGIQGKPRFVTLPQMEKKKGTLCLCVHALGCQKQEDRNGEERGNFIFRL